MITYKIIEEYRIYIPIGDDESFPIKTQVLEIHDSDNWKKFSYICNYKNNKLRVAKNYETLEGCLLEMFSDIESLVVTDILKPNERY